MAFITDILQHSGSLLAIAAVVFTLAIRYWAQASKTPFPIVNQYSFDLTRGKAYAAYFQNAKDLIKDGLTKHKGPINVDTPSGIRTILPSSLMDWVKNNKDLNHQTLVRHDFFAEYPGFEANAVLQDPGNLVIDVIKTKLSQNGRLVPIVNEHVNEALTDSWTKDTSWHTLDWYPATTGLISRAAASVFAGSDMARNPEWQDITVTYATNFFAACFALMRWPAWTRPIVHWFLPEAQACRRLLKRARQYMHIVIDKRRKEKEQGLAKEYLDVITWTQDSPDGRASDQGGIQLALAMASMVTTADSLRQTLLDICAHQELISPLREEIQRAFSEDGVSAAALAKMRLLESVMKESQRCGPHAIINLEREATNDTFLPDGTKIPQGAVIAVDTSNMWNPDIHEHPEKYDGYRYLRMREAGDERTAFVSSSREHVTFGMGRHICPGRFLAAVEIKLCLAHILLKYDVRLKEGYEPKSIPAGFFVMGDPAAKVEVRRRGDGGDI